MSKFWDLFRPSAPLSAAEKQQVYADTYDNTSASLMRIPPEDYRPGNEARLSPTSKARYIARLLIGSEERAFAAGAARAVNATAEVVQEAPGRIAALGQLAWNAATELITRANDLFHDSAADPAVYRPQHAQQASGPRHLRPQGMAAPAYIQPQDAPESYIA